MLQVEIKKIVVVVFTFLLVILKSATHPSVCPLSVPTYPCRAGFAYLQWSLGEKQGTSEQISSPTQGNTASHTLQQFRETNQPHRLCSHYKYGQIFVNILLM